MEKIVWNEILSVGVRELDEDHKKLIKLINSLIEMEANSLSLEVISDTLNEMTRYAQEHFAFEEELLRKCNYPGYLSQQSQHKEFVKTTVKFCMDTMVYKESTPVEIVAFLKDWLIDHILLSDMQYKPFLLNLSENGGSRS